MSRMYDIMSESELRSGLVATDARVKELEAENKRLTEASNRRLMGYIMRICPDCGDDMCGDEHKTCYKCILRGVLTALNTGDIQKDSLLHKHIRQTFSGEQTTARFTKGDE